MRLAVIIPSWDPERVLRTVRHMAERAVVPEEVEYIGVISGIRGAPSVSHEELRLLSKLPRFLSWLSGPERLGVLEAMRDGARFGTGNNADYLLFLHDDVDVLEIGWDRYILDTLSGLPRCGLAGFGGALGFASDDIYKTPYRLQQLARSHFMSNFDNWQDHGYQATEHQRVTALDGFSLLLTREAYAAIGGWEAAIQDGMPVHHMYDAWVCCAIAEQGFETWLLPVKCHHWGGRTGTTAEYQEFIKSRGWESGDQLFEFAHQRIYDRFRSVLPLRLSL